MVEAREGGGGARAGYRRGGSRAPQTKRPDEASSAARIARTAPKLH